MSNVEDHWSKSPTSKRFSLSLLAVSLSGPAFGTAILALVVRRLMCFTLSDILATRFERSSFSRMYRFWAVLVVG